MAKKAAKKPKATQVEKRARELVVQDLLLEGQTRSYIVRFGAENWKLAARQMDQYIHEATETIQEINEGEAEQNLALVTSNLWKLFRENISYKPNVSRQALMNIAKLRGLDKDELILRIKRDHKDATDEELAAAMGQNA